MKLVQTICKARLKLLGNSLGTRVFVPAVANGACEERSSKSDGDAGTEGRLDHCHEGDDGHSRGGIERNHIFDWCLERTKE